MGEDMSQNASSICFLELSGCPCLKGGFARRFLHEHPPIGIVRDVVQSVI